MYGDFIFSRYALRSFSYHILGSVREPEGEMNRVCAYLFISRRFPFVRYISSCVIP